MPALSTRLETLLNAGEFLVSALANPTSPLRHYKTHSDRTDAGSLR